MSVNIAIIILLHVSDALPYSSLRSVPVDLVEQPTLHLQLPGWLEMCCFDEYSDWEALVAFTGHGQKWYMAFRSKGSSIPNAYCVLFEKPEWT